MLLNPKVSVAQHAASTWEGWMSKAAESSFLLNMTHLARIRSSSENLIDTYPAPTRITLSVEAGPGTLLASTTARP
jgi:hypothetical protein